MPPFYREGNEGPEMESNVSGATYTLEHIVNTKYMVFWIIFSLIFFVQW